MIRRTIETLNILDNTTDMFCPVFRPPLEIQTIQQPDTFGNIWIPDLSGIPLVTVIKLNRFESLAENRDSSEHDEGSSLSSFDLT